MKRFYFCEPVSEELPITCNPRLLTDAAELMGWDELRMDKSWHIYLIASRQSLKLILMKTNNMERDRIQNTVDPPYLWIPENWPSW